MAGIPGCVTRCMASANTGHCASSADYLCLCGNHAYQGAVVVRRTLIVLTEAMLGDALQRNQLRPRALVRLGRVYRHRREDPARHQRRLHKPHDDAHHLLEDGVQHPGRRE